MQCVESLRVQAYFDGEFDAVSAADVERHAEVCAECRALLEELEQTRAALRQDLNNAGAPPALRALVMRMLDQELELVPHCVICIRRRDHPRLHRQSGGRYRIGFIRRSLCWAHRIPPE